MVVIPTEETVATLPLCRSRDLGGILVEHYSIVLEVPVFFKLFKRKKGESLEKNLLMLSQGCEIWNFFFF